MLDANQSLKSFLIKTGLNRSAIKKLMTTENLLLINGEAANNRAWLQEGDILDIIFDFKEETAITPVKKPLEIIFEDESFLIINKPKKLLTLSTNWEKDSVASRLIAYYQKHNIPQTAHILTRLDYETGGLMLIAKNGFVHSLMSDVNIERIYHAEVKGDFPYEQLLADFAIAKKFDSNTRYVSESGKSAQTLFRKKSFKNKVSVVEAQLLTGRTHQIRVHLSYLGYPIIGDSRYGLSGKKDSSIALKLDCVKVKFKHPLKNEMVSLQL